MLGIDWDVTVLGPVHEIFDNALVTYIPVTGAPFDCTGIFDREYRRVVVLEDGGEAVTSAAPMLGVRVALIPGGPVQGDKVVIPIVNTTYIVREVQPDGHGEVRLMLNKISSP